jgi:hypothetical protein
MIYDFYVLTTLGMKNATVTTDSDFDCAPFGYVPYRAISSCTCDSNIIDDFWNCVDDVLSAHNLTSTEYTRAVRAYSNGKLYGEYDG